MKLEVDERYLVLVGTLNSITPIPNGCSINELITSYIKTVDLQITINQFNNDELILFQNPYNHYPTGIIDSTGLIIYGNAVIARGGGKEFSPISFAIAQRVFNEITYLGSYTT
ncbi:MAG: hypothetical protein QNJ51_03090 [Calothrix sp. MO_167.B12]|nr:hypothetical protein [Calothrix sp. MO_167.B12]